jgi:hypothetical protein
MRGVAGAFSEGIRRVLSAPLLLAAVAAASLLSPLYPTVASRRLLLEYALVSSFLCGGIIDRYARARPTRAHGFFGACGRHLGAMLRLAGIEVLLYLAVDNLPVGRWAALAALAVLSAFLFYARVRIVVEDRRSAIGAIRAAMRFIVRNPAAGLIYSAWMAAALLLGSWLRGAGPILLLPLFATATAFFQSRLAHAHYTAAPPLQWPESPAAEAIVNRR